jgi:hypothetical protein
MRTARWLFLRTFAIKTYLNVDLKRTMRIVVGYEIPVQCPGAIHALNVSSEASFSEASFNTT